MTLKDRLKGWPKGWLREPLVHFLIGGAAVWLFLAWQGEAADPASRSITVTQEDRARMALQWQRMMQRPPTDAELDSLTQTWLREEVLYREALRLGLDRDDAVVRKRMANKMDFLAASMAETATPDDAVLQAWLRDNPQRFASDVRYSFEQLYFAEKSLAERALQSGDPAGSAEVISLPRTIESAPARRVAQQFGERFTQSLNTMQPGPEWQGPVATGFGWHLVWLTEREAGAVPQFKQIREGVLTDWRAETMEQRRADAYALLRDEYSVTIKR